MLFSAITRSIQPARPVIQTTNPIAALTFTAYGSNPVITKTNGINEFEVVLSGGTYYLFWSPDTAVNGPTYCDTATSLNGPWTPLNSGASLFNGRYCTVINDGGTWKAWANNNADLHYFTASSPGGTWTDQGLAITPPGSGAFSAGILDPCVRKMLDGTYILAGTDITYTIGNIGYWTSATGANGSWTLARYPLLDYSQHWEGPRRSDPAPFISSNGDFVITYSGYPDGSSAQPSGMAIYDPALGGFVVRPTAMMSDVAGSGNPVIYEFSAGVYTLVWGSYPTPGSTTNGGLSYATAAAGTRPYVQRTWDGTPLP